LNSRFFASDEVAKHDNAMAKQSKPAPARTKALRRFKSTLNIAVAILGAFRTTIHRR
jgi:hypothetical protein